MSTKPTALIKEIEEKPNNTPTVAGGLHRGWLAAINPLSFDEDEVTLENVLSEENAAITAFENALESGDLDASSSKVVQVQLQV